VTEGKPRLI